ncbi:MAG: hypothetical protein GWM98_00665 [Nitrospinaceae bacterium]|nr:hypothetical protein [Nitrospinaceae bacterium]
MSLETEQPIGCVGDCVEVIDVERVLPVSTANEKRLRFCWKQKPSAEFLMTWNRFMEPNSMFIEDLDETGLTVTVRWGLMKKSAEEIAVQINAWLEKCETGTWKKSGAWGRRMQ